MAMIDDILNGINTQIKIWIQNGVVIAAITLVAVPIIIYLWNYLFDKGRE